MRRSLVLLPLCLALASCGGPDPDRDADGVRDTIDCAPDDATVYPGADDTCDEVDSDCNGVVDDGEGVVHGLTYRDVDEDGFGVTDWPDYDGCERTGWVRAETHPDLDCNDANASVTPLTPQLCDYDGDGSLGGVDCDDHDRMRRPGYAEQCNGFDDDCDGAIDDADTTPPFGGRGIYVLDADQDTYPNEIILACAPPGGAWEEVSSSNPVDCAPNDPMIHPGQLDDCATMTDRNCDGVFRPVVVDSLNWNSMSPEELGAKFTASTPGQPPTPILLGAWYTGTVLLCPGTYRVSLLLGSWGLDSHFVVRGRGASPSDVVLDGGGSARIAEVQHWLNLDQDGRSAARFENLTFANGHASEGGGCLAAEDNGVSTLELDHVAFTGCSAERGGALSIGSGATATITDTTFANSSATTRGGAIDFVTAVLTMTNGSFLGTTAPSGSAIAATLSDSATLSLTGVDLSPITNDVAVTIGTTTLTRDLGASASLSCTSAGCTP